jgi:hypothetical protein
LGVAAVLDKLFELDELRASVMRRVPPSPGARGLDDSRRPAKNE